MPQCLLQKLETKISCFPITIRQHFAFYFLVLLKIGFLKILSP